MLRYPIPRGRAGEPLQRGVKYTGSGKNLRFSTEIAVYLGNNTRETIGYYGTFIGSHRWQIDPYWFPMTLSYLESRDARGQFFRRISLPFYGDNDQIRQLYNTWGVFLGFSHAPTARGRCPAALPSFGVACYLCIQPLTQKFDVAITVGVCWGQPRLPSQGSRVPALPNLEIILSLCLHPLTQNE